MMSTRFPLRYPLRIHRHGGRLIASRFLSRSSGGCCLFPLMALPLLLKRLIHVNVARV